MAIIQKLQPCLWFEKDAESAAKFYTSIFKNSQISSIVKYGDSASKTSGMPKGTTMSVSFTLEGQEFLALNGGPLFKFSEAISFMIMCKDQKEIDYYWDKLTSDGQEGPCGWLKDKYGLSWQVVAEKFEKLLTGPNGDKYMAELCKMKKPDMNKLEAAAK